MHPWRPKVVRARQFLTLLTSKCASRHNGVQRALFWHRNFQKWSDHGVFCTFWLRNVFRATTACTFSTSQLLKVVRLWCVLYLLASKRASRHNDVQLFISHLARWLRARRFSEPTFRPSGATNLLYLFAHLRLLSSNSFSSLIFSLLLFSSLLWLFPPLLFHLSILSEVWLTKLPSIICNQTFWHIVQKKCFYAWIIDMKWTKAENQNETSFWKARYYMSLVVLV